MKLLFATDGSDAAEAAEEFLKLLPLPPGSALRVLTVVDSTGWEALVSYLALAYQWAGSVVEKACASLVREGVEVRSAARYGSRDHEIIEDAAEIGADLLVIGSQRLTGLKAFLLGSITQNVAKHARCPVLAARRPEHELRRVVLAVDGSEHSSKAVTYVTPLPLPPETEVVVLHVVPHYDPFPGLLPTDQPEFQQEVEKVRRQLHRAGVELAERARCQLEAAGMRTSDVVKVGDPATEILSLAIEQEADLIILGARGVSLIQGLRVGSVADRILKAARSSVLFVR